MGPLALQYQNSIYIHAYLNLSFLYVHLHPQCSNPNPILDEARTVASNLGFEEQFKQKRRRKRKGLPDEDTRNAHSRVNEEDRFRIDVL